MKKKINRVFQPLKEKYYVRKSSSELPGSKDWLVGKELKYGGRQVNVPRNKVSPKDPRTQDQLQSGGMIGGDRMLHHGYASKYAEYLEPIVKSNTDVTLAEFGILKGTGLAIWCDLFEKGRIIGFDIDLGHTTGNMSNLKSLGAFQTNRPELHEYDQFEDNIEYLGQILNGDKVNICIDDGFHSNESIMCTMASIMPHMAEDMVYIIEDNSDVHKEIREKYPSLKVENEGELTLVTRHATV